MPGKAPATGRRPRAPAMARSCDDARRRPQSQPRPPQHCSHYERARRSLFTIWRPGFSAAARTVAAIVPSRQGLPRAPATSFRAPRQHDPCRKDTCHPRFLSLPFPDGRLCCASWSSAISAFLLFRAPRPAPRNGRQQDNSLSSSRLAPPFPHPQHREDPTRQLGISARGEDEAPLVAMVRDQACPRRPRRTSRTA